MGTDVDRPRDPMAEFQEKIIAKVRDDIAGMLPDEAVEALIKRAVEESFFKPGSKPAAYGRTSAEPSWFVQEVAKVAEPHIKRRVDSFMSSRAVDIDRAIDEFLDDNKLTILMTKKLTDQFELLAQAMLNKMQGY